MSPDLDQLTAQLRQFAAEREWTPFHAPKNLAMALAAEAGELLEHFQWIGETQSDQLDAAQREAVADEVCDVLFYLLQLSDRLGIDLAQATQRKLAINARRYPVERSRGSSRKTELD